MNSIDPSFQDINTHPPTLQRYRNIIDSFSKDFFIDGKEANEWIEHHDKFMDIIIKAIEKNKWFIEGYGSVYLEMWRDKVRIDRIDY